MGETPAEQLHAMTKKWDAMYESGARDGKALLLLAFQLRHFSQKYMDARTVPGEVRAQEAIHFDRIIITSHMVCARECLEARAYREAITHTLKASELCQVHQDGCVDLLTDVLFCQKEAWCGLGEPTGMLSTSGRRTASELAGPRRVEALAASATGILLDFPAAVATARGLSVDGVPGLAEHREDETRGCAAGRRPRGRKPCWN